MATAVTAIQLRENYRALQNAEQLRLDQQAQLRYWEQIVAAHPGYRDAYYKLATIQLSLGDGENAQKTLEKALVIDPEFQAGKTLRAELHALF